MPIPLELPPQHVFTPDSAQRQAWGIDDLKTQEEQIQGEKFKFVIKDGTLLVLAIDPTATKADLAAEIVQYVAPGINQAACEQELTTNAIDKNLFTYDGKVNTIFQSTYSRIYSVSCVDGTVIMRGNVAETPVIAQAASTPVPPSIESTDAVSNGPVTIFNFESDTKTTTTSAVPPVQEFGAFKSWLEKLGVVGVGSLFLSALYWFFKGRFRQGSRQYSTHVMPGFSQLGEEGKAFKPEVGTGDPRGVYPTQGHDVRGRAAAEENGGVPGQVREIHDPALPAPKQ